MEARKTGHPPRVDLMELQSHMNLLDGQTNSSSFAGRGVSLGTMKPSKPSSRRPTISDLAAHLEVHPSTISLALRNSPKVSQVVREKIHTLAQDWGYVPNHMARTLRIQRTRLLGMVFPYASIPHYGTMLDRIYQRIEKVGYRGEVLFHDWNEERERAAIRTLLEQQVEGLIINPSTLDPEALLQDIMPSKNLPPVVVLGRPPRVGNWRHIRTCVTSNSRIGARMIADHLLSRGHRCVALLVGEDPVGRSTSAMRVASMRQAFRRQAGTHFHLVTLSGQARSDGGPEEARHHGSTAMDMIHSSKTLVTRLLGLKPFPSAVVTSDETIAHVLLGSLASHGMKVPEDISLATFGGTLLASYGAVPLTTIEYPFDEIAQVALDSLLHPVARTMPKVRLLIPSLADRGSVRTISRTGARRSRSGSSTSA